jgi:hypothetical protein
MHLDLSDAPRLSLRTSPTSPRVTVIPFRERTRTLKAILSKLRPEPVREPLPPPKVSAPPKAPAAAAEGNDAVSTVSSSAS